MAAHSLAELEIAIRASWSRWTSDPVDHAVCSAERPARGQVRSPRRPGPARRRAARGRDRGVDWPTPRWVTSTAQLSRASSSSCLLGVGTAHSRTGPRAGARGTHGARPRGRSQRGSRVRAAVTPAIMSERAFGLGNRRESRKQVCQSASTPTRMLVRLLPQSGRERGNQEAPREVEMSATASGPPRLMGPG